MIEELLTQPNSEKFEAKEADVEKWKAGAEEYGEFCDRFKGISSIPQDKTAVQTMFLGEKPATFQDAFSLEVSKGLLDHGFKANGDYVYDPEQVKMVMAEHSGVFEEKGLKTPEEVFDFLKSKKLGEEQIIRGLVLGIPQEAVFRHEELEKNPKAIIFGINGVYWADYPDSKSSLEKVARLKAALEVLEKETRGSF